jgi:thioredoxin-related protein
MNSVLAAFILMQTVVDMTASLSPSPVSPMANVAHPQARPFDAKAIADIDVSSALTRAALANKHVIIVMGANWCHDSIGLAGWFATPRFAAMLSSKYEVVYVDVGVPQTGNGRNSDIAKRFKAKPVKGTPTVLILSPQGKLINKKDAGSWRNAASRSEDEIYRYFAELP